MNTDEGSETFHRDKCAWESAISTNTSHDPFELWYNYISWYEQNRQNDAENKFQKTLERCLSQYEHDESHKQDLRMIKLWMKYIGMQQNPLHLYQLLYQRNIGTQLSAFYIGWAHYYDAANAYKQAESVYNLGFQAKALPVEELQAAHTKFRISVSQRMLYDDNLSKKRAASNLIDQRNVITSINPPDQKKKLETDEFYEAKQFNGGASSTVTSDDTNGHPAVTTATAEPAGYNYQANGVVYETVPEDDNQCDLKNSGFMIASSLNSVYDDTENYVEEQQLEEVVDASAIHPGGVQLPANFSRSAKNHHEAWHVQLCLEEPYDANRRCNYPKALVYPGDGNEYSMDEIRSRRWEKRRTELLEQKKAEMMKLQQQLQHQQIQLQQQKQLQLQQQQHKQLMQQQQQHHYNSPQAAAPHYPAAVVEQSPQSQYQYQNPQYAVAAPDPQLTYYPHQQHSPHLAQQQQHQHTIHQPQYPIQYQTHQYHNIPPQQQQQIPVVHTPPPSQQQYIHHAATEGYPHAQTLQQQQPPPQTQYYNNQQQQSQTQSYLSPRVVAVQGNGTTPSPTPQYSNYSISQTTIESPPISDSATSKTQKRKRYDDFDYDEQIEASTIQYYPNSSVTKPQTIRIKFKKEKPANQSTPVVPSPSLNAAPIPAAVALASAKPSTSTPKTSRKSRKLKPPVTPADSGFAISSESNSTDSQQRYNKNNIDDANLLLSMANMQHSSSNEDSSQSYNSYAAHRRPAAARVPVEEPFINEDSYSNSSFNGIYCDNSNSTPIKTPANIRFTNSAKISTPLQNFKYQNDDSNCSFTGEQNSYFASESDEEIKNRRLEKALATIKTHLEKTVLDPFSNELCKAFLTKLDFPPRNDRDVCQVVNAVIPKLFNTKTATLGDTTYHVEKEVGRGAYGAVYRAVNTNSGDIVALKFQKPSNSWELYICTEVRKRISNHDMFPGFMGVSSSIVGRNASILVSEFSQYGSLLDINNRIRTATTKVMHESLVMHFTSQILSVVDHLHRCKIIHADIKPDNFLLMKIPTSDSHVPTLRLIDFGCAIDMTLFEENTQFKKVIQTDGFTCIEMQEGRPWSYQTDLFCVAGTVHVMLFGEYMQLVKRFGSEWDIKQKLPRYLKKNMWTSFFSKLLNIKDIRHLPDLNDLKAAVDDELYNMESELQKHIRTLSNILHKR